MNCDDFWIQDCSAAMQNILLSATELGLGSVWIGVHPIKKLEKSVREILELPKEVVPLGIAYIGYSDEIIESKIQDYSKVHTNKFSVK